jgi:hypothetical protein
MDETEVRVRCIESFSLQSLIGGRGIDTTIQIRRNQRGVALKYVLTDGSRFYEIEMSGYMFSMRQESFDKFMEEVAD